MVFKLANIKSLDGIIIISTCLKNYITTEEFSNFYNNYNNIPVISIGYELTNSTNILVDNYGGMKDIIIHLIKHHGYKRIVFIKGPENNIEANIRFNAYKDTLAEYNIPFIDELIIQGAFFGDSGKNAVRFLIDEKKIDFDAVIASNDIIAIDVIKELNNRNIKVPEDIAVTGFDNIIDGQYLAKPLTTVNQPEFHIGYMAIKTLYDRLNGCKVKNKIILPTNMIIRNTCGCNIQDNNDNDKILLKYKGLKNNINSIIEYLIPEIKKYDIRMAG